MLISQAIRRGIALLLVLPVGCRNADHGDAPPETSRPSADSSRPPAAMVASANDTVTLSHPHAGAPPVLIVGTATIVLDSTTLAQIQTALGAPSIARSKGSRRQLYACYVAGARSDRVTVRLLALDDLDADADTTMQHALATIPLLSVAIARGDVIGDAWSAPKRCAPLSVPPAEIHWVGGLRLGMTRAEVDRLLGAPNDRLDDDWIYQHDEPNAEEVSVDTATGKQAVRRVHVMATMQVRYDHDVATQIEGTYWKEYAHP
jgi:hypothetical protein